MKRLFFIFAMVSVGLFANGQNLVPNPSFESWTSCPAVGGGIVNLNNWYKLTGHSGSPDVFHPCGGNGSSFGYPTNVFGNQTANTGSCYIGFVTYFVSANWREYFQVQLTTPLSAGTTYEVEAYVSLSDGSGYGTDGYDFYFSNTAITASGSAPLTAYTPQVQNPSGNHMTNKVGWTRITGSFVAAGGERYLTIGNFQMDAQTSFANVGGWTWNYSYMDDVSVTPSVVLSADIGALTAEWGNGPFSRLSWDTQNEEGVAYFEVERSLGANDHFESIAQVEGNANLDKVGDYLTFDHEAELNRSNFYRLKVVDTDGSFAYSNTVELSAYQPEDYLVKLYPNPMNTGATANLMLHLAQDQSIEVSIHDISGRQIQQNQVAGVKGVNRVDIPTESLAPGYYLVQYHSGNLNGTEKLVIE